MKKIMIMMALVLVGTMTFAQRGPREGGQRGDNRPNRDDRKEMIAERLDLSDEQQQQIEDLRISHLKTTSETKSQLDIKKAELEAAIKGEKPVDKLIGEIGKLENQLLDARVKHRIAVRNTLNDEQKLKFDQLKGGHHGPKGGHGYRGK
ncbi:Spy/CpxP family protein refolding chaperone [Marinoscillum pacificum]|uniref:Spy/CpxP family protein refolding chaperone n=1 Tax=Marinoscillum pacificum TaxID=392723 RepID=UPI002157D10E|nr:Spy/CpxP family protein refolding chaperone [Marinoscillum pacificum]